MSTQRLSLTGLIILALLAPGASQSLAQPAASPAAPAFPTAPGSMLIVENAGQWPAAARFQVWNSPLGPGVTWLAEDAIWLVVASGRSQVAGSEGSAGPRADLPPANLQPATLHALKLTFPGSNPDARIEPFEAVDTTVSYFIGNDPAQWRPDVPVWGGVRYVDLYPGVDLVLGGRDAAWRLEAASGAAVEQVRVQIQGADLVAVDGAVLYLDSMSEQLALALPFAPFAYNVAGLSSQGDPLTRTVGVSLRASQTARPANSPGQLLYSTFLGGTASEGDRWDRVAIAVDDGMASYVTGRTHSIDFPSTPGAFDPGLTGVVNVFVAKLNPAGSELVYATFLGGDGGSWGKAITVDATGAAFVTGVTGDSFPTTPGAYDPSYNGAGDAFVARLNPTGSNLIYATYLGGSNDDILDEGYAIAVSSNGAATVTGKTGSSDFPTTPGALDTSHNGGYFGYDAFVTKLNTTGTHLDFSTFLGGNQDDWGYGIAMDTNGAVYVTGSTGSSDFPTSLGAFDVSCSGCGYYGGDAFVAKLNAAGSQLDYGTFLGGSGGDWGSSVTVDRRGATFITGGTGSTDFPATPGSSDTTLGGSADGFVAKLNAAGSNVDYATFLGGGEDDCGYGVAIDQSGAAYITGETQSGDFPTTSSAFDRGFNAYIDVFVVKVNPLGSGLAYATYLGGSQLDFGRSITVDGRGAALVTGMTKSLDFPTTPDTFDSSYNGGDSDVFAGKLDTYTPEIAARIEWPNVGSWISGTVTLRGFAIDWGSAMGPGIDAVRVYLDGPMGSGALLGNVTYGLARPDVAAQYGAAFALSGWELAWDTTGLPLGIHRLHLYAHRVTDGVWTAGPSHLVVVAGEHVRWLPIVLAQR